MMAKDLVTIERHALTPAHFGHLADLPSSLNGSPISNVRAWLGHRASMNDDKTWPKSRSCGVALVNVRRG